MRTPEDEPLLLISSAPSDPQPAHSLAVSPQPPRHEVLSTQRRALPLLWKRPSPRITFLGGGGHVNGNNCTWDCRERLQEENKDRNGNGFSSAPHTAEYLSKSWGCRTSPSPAHLSRTLFKETSQGEAQGETLINILDVLYLLTKESPTCGVQDASTAKSAMPRILLRGSSGGETHHTE